MPFDQTIRETPARPYREPWRPNDAPRRQSVSKHLAHALNENVAESVALSLVADLLDDVERHPRRARDRDIQPSAAPQRSPPNTHRLHLATTSKPDAKRRDIEFD